MDNKKCAHPSCSCQAPEGQSYCSKACERKEHDRNSVPVSTSGMSGHRVETYLTGCLQAVCPSSPRRAGDLLGFSEALQPFTGLRLLFKTIVCS